LEDDEHTGWPRKVRTNSRSKKLQHCVPTAPKQKMKLQQQGLAMALATKFSDDLNMCRVTQHSVPRFLIQDQRDTRMSICSDRIDSVDDDSTFLNRIITGDKR
jgi:hypothetical protein